MLTRVYLDNYRCFVNFEYRPGGKQLIFGRNGSGKSSFLDAVLLLRQFITRGDILESYNILAYRTRWINQPQQVFEIETELDGAPHVYRLVIEPWGGPRAAASSFGNSPLRWQADL